MTVVKHTPPPWTYSGGEVLDAQGNQIAQLYDSFRDPAEDDANGLLMAAVPELRDAVKAAIDLIDGDATGAEWKRGCAEFRKAGRAALAKSEGLS